MEDYKKNLAAALAQTGALFFKKDLKLKDGRPTPYFVNFGMFRTGRLSMDLGTFFADMIVARGIIDRTDIILGPSYKGSAIALATTIALHVHYGYDLLFEYDRKEAKDHGEGSTSASLMVNRALFDGCRIFIVDDVATSMGTKYELLDTLEREEEANRIRVRVIGLGIAIDREQTAAVYDKGGNVIPGIKGEDAIRTFHSRTGIPVYSIAGIREVMDYLYREKVPLMINGNRQPIDEKTKALFDDYLKTYGSDHSL